MTYLSLRLTPTTLARLAIAALSLASGVARADRNIVVDGLITDWSGATSCLSGPFGTSGVPISKVCVENDNTTSNTGNFYVLMQTTSAPTGDFYAGVELDSNLNGAFDINDNVWAAHFPAGSDIATQLVLADQNFNVKATYNTSSCGGPAGSDGWKAVKNGSNIEVSIAYGCLALSHCDDSRLVAVGDWDSASGVKNQSTSAFFNGSTDALPALLALPTSSTPEAKLFTATGGNGQVTLRWTNPQQHEGVVVLHSKSAIPSTLALTKGTTYTVGQTVATGVTVAYVDRGSCATSYVDTGVSNGTGEYYRLYNHDQALTYAVGNVPSTNGLTALPTSRVAPSPLYCYSVGFPNVAQPSLQKNTAVFSSGNIGAVTAVQTSTANASLDGQELWRPTKLSGTSQSRSPIVPLVWGSSNYMLTGDQGGRAYVMDTATGIPVWTVTLSGPIQAQPGAQLYTYANGAFQAQNAPGGVPRDLIFFATRNGTSNNEVYALDGKTGAQVWKYSPGDLDIVNGGMLVDYANNRLWVGAYSNTGAQASLRVLDTLTGNELKRFSLGNLDYGINQDFQTKQAYVVSVTDPTGKAGTVSSIYAFDLGTMTQTWSYALPATPVSYAFPTGSGFLISLKAPTGGSASVNRFAVSGTPAAVTRTWSTNIAGPSGVTVTYGSNAKVYVGSSDAKVHQLNAATGVDEKQVSLSPATTVGMPTIDSTAGRLSVGTFDGRLCTFAVPF